MSFLEMFANVLEDLETHGGDWTRPGFQAVALNRFGAWRAGLKNKVVRAPLTAVYRAAFVFVRNVYGIEIPYTVKLGRKVVVEHQGGIVVHANSEIGQGCILRQGVTLGIRTMNKLDEAPKLGRNVNVGCGAAILGGITIGNNSSIGANAVVLHDVPDNTLVVGIPAKPANVYDDNTVVMFPKRNQS